MNILRRLSLPRLIALCGLVIAIGVSATALASALGGGPTPPAKPLAQAIHDALGGSPVQGLSAEVKLTDRLLEGANLAGGSGQTGESLSNPLISGASGRLWVASDGRMRLELQSEKGDTQVIYDGHTVTIYDAVQQHALPLHAARQERRRHRRQARRPEHDPQRREDRRSDRQAEEACERLRSHARPMWGASPPTPCGSRPRKAAACWAAPSSPSTRSTACRCVPRSTPRPAPRRSSNWRPARSPTARSTARSSPSRRPPARRSSRSNRPRTTAVAPPPPVTDIRT